MTYREIFNKYLPKDVAELAIKNTIKSSVEPNSKVFINETNQGWSELKQAMYTAFYFENTEQGSGYWFNILDTYE